MPALAEDVENLERFLDQYHYHSDLTSRLDQLSSTEITTSLLHEIVLWKLNRYPYIPESLINKVNKIQKIQPRKHRKSEKLLVFLLKCDGVDLPMASTILRFKNPNAFQIIDRHAYRALYGSDYPFSAATSIKKKINGYFNYLDDLHKLSKNKNIRFRDLDRILYIFDKNVNGKL
jgi:hypothetical protein